MSVTWKGLDQLEAALRRLPAELTVEARAIVRAHAETAATDIRAAYPVWDGPPSYIEGRLVRPDHLRDAVEVIELQSNQFSAIWQVINVSALAYVYENGAVRSTRGTTQAAHVFIPRVILHRRRMWEVLKNMVVDHGLLVRGEVDGFA